eukprot:8113889-Pyramimonas_sp.AAC.2
MNYHTKKRGVGCGGLAGCGVCGAWLRAPMCPKVLADGGRATRNWAFGGTLTHVSTASGPCYVDRRVAATFGHFGPPRGHLFSLRRRRRGRNLRTAEADGVDEDYFWSLSRPTALAKATLGHYRDPWRRWRRRGRS